MSADEEVKEARSQRHDFVKEYYKMATLDLDRHLKAGWQTIAVLAGGAAVLTAGHDGKIGLPIACGIALISAIWGVLTVIDANYWSLRAIAFLSNVEAVYFSVEDRKSFNPYVGYHPPFKLLDSLRYMLWLCVLFGTSVILSMIWEIHGSYPSPQLMYSHFRLIPMISRILWSFPIIVCVWGIFWILKVWTTRLDDYLKFSTESPGPGVRLTTLPLRLVTLAPIMGGAAIQIEANTNSAMQTASTKGLMTWRCSLNISLVLAVLATLAIGLLAAGIL